MIRRMSRRDLLKLAAPVIAVPLVPWRQGPAASRQSTEDVPACVVRPQQTEGPYFIDERLRRSDIRADTADGKTQHGVPLHLAFRVSRIAGDSCAPVEGALIDVWQCNATGVYSAFRDINGLFDTRGQDFLRGYQNTNSRGVAEFVTIYPGWYGGRAVHIHFKVRTATGSQSAHEFTSQLYFDDSITDDVHAEEPYRSKGRRTARNEDDGIFRRSGDGLILPLTRDGRGYRGSFELGLQLT
jgi:protocatechuate 3,4-dioxygenase beta subunit